MDSGSLVSISGGTLAFVYRALRCFVGPFSGPLLLVVRVRGRFVVAFFRLGSRFCISVWLSDSKCD